MKASFNFKSQFARLVRVLLARGLPAHEAEDAVQEAYVRLLTYVNEGKVVEKPEAFLTQVAYNSSSDARRRHGFRLIDVAPVEDLELTDTHPGPDDLADAEVLLERVQTALDRLVGERARQVFFLHCYEGFTYEEIAKQVGLTARTVENDLVKATSALAGIDLLRQLRGRTRSPS